MAYEAETTDENAVGSEEPEVNEARRALVEQWCGRVKQAEEHYKETFSAMRTSMEFARIGADKAWKDGGNYTVPILPRYINQAVSTLYARNPKAVFKRRQRLMYRLWDERSDSLQAAMESAAMGDPSGLPMLQEVLAVRQENLMLDRMGNTLRILWEYYLNEQGANYKQQLKAAVRRAKICKVAYIKLGFQRMLEPRPEITARIEDVTSKIAAVEKTLADVAAGKVDDQSPDVEQLRLNLQDLQREEMLVVREGPVLDFPKSDQIIIDPACVHLKSFSGANWIAHKFEVAPGEIQSIWGVDVGSLFRAYDRDGKAYDGDKDKTCAHVYEIWDKKHQQVSVVCEGYPDFVKEPATPDVWTERFWPFFPIVFNEVEHHKEIFPMSDLEQARDIQNEYNRSREQLRQHRIASRPYWVEGAGMSKDEKNKLANRKDHEVVTLPTLGTNRKATDLLQPGPTAPIDPNLYEVEQHFTDLMRVVGFQEAQVGATSGATATESSIAQQAQSASQSDNVDDLDEVLTDLSRAAGQIMLLNVDKQTVIEVVGDGAVWPNTPETKEAAAKEIMLEVEAGSTGRPNQAADLANMERGMPFLLQLPNIDPNTLGRRYAGLLNMDVDELITDGMPSITALNAMMAKMAVGNGAAPTGDAATDPNAQGAAGAQNAPSTESGGPGPQPAYTPPVAA